MRACIWEGTDRSEDVLELNIESVLAGEEVAHGVLLDTRRVVRPPHRAEDVVATAAVAAAPWPQM